MPRGGVDGTEFAAFLVDSPPVAPDPPDWFPSTINHKPKPLLIPHMKQVAVLLFAALFSFGALTAEDIAVSARVLDRAADGTPIRGEFVFPQVELASGKTASVHIGETVRYPRWDAAPDSADAAEDVPTGLTLKIRADLVDDGIAYSGEVAATEVRGASSEGAGLIRSMATFRGTVESGEMISVRIESPDGVAEDVTLHFEER